MKHWSSCKNILCIRPDNMGDLLMSAPAIRALKESFQCKITVLTSSMASGICNYIEEIDDVISYDLPWVKTKELTQAASVNELIDRIRRQEFDAAVIFSVYSQNPLPAAMIAYLAGVPRRLAYCRENPYELLTDWVPDKEPYYTIKHQVRRDLELVGEVGASTKNETLSLQVPSAYDNLLEAKLVKEGINISRPWLIVHAGVSEKKREFPIAVWVDVINKLRMESGYQVLLTGSAGEKKLTDHLRDNTGDGVFSIAGALQLGEFIKLVERAPLLISVNTGPVHIAAATGTPVIVLYAQTNPQHLPWKAKGRSFVFDVPPVLRSKNEVIKFVHDQLFFPANAGVCPNEIYEAAKEILENKTQLPDFPELLPLVQQEESRSSACL